MRELSPDPLPRDHQTVYVSAQTWECPYCDQPGGSGTTVDWVGNSNGEWRGPDGRCRTCGLKFVLVPGSDRNIPSPEEQLGSSD